MNHPEARLQLATTVMFTTLYARIVSQWNGIHDKTSLIISIIV